MLLKTENKPILEELETEIDNEGKKPSLLSQLIPLLPKICFYGFFSLSLLFIIISQIDISSKIKRKPVFAELSNGKTAYLQQQDEGYRSKSVIFAHIMEIMPLLTRMSNKLPEELGGGRDEGVIPNGMEVKIPRVIEAASFNLTEDGRLETLKAIASQFPTGMWEGEQKLLRIYHLDDPIKTEDGYMVYMQASFYIADRNGQPKDAMTFNREIYLVPVEIPKFVLKPDALQLIINGLQRRGLMISYLKPRRDE
jgi:hypothetical protein